MARTAQILFLLVLALAVQCNAGRRYYHGRSHGRYHPPYDYYPSHQHGRHGDSSSHKHGSSHHNTPDKPDDRPVPQALAANVPGFTPFRTKVENSEPASDLNKKGDSKEADLIENNHRSLDDSSHPDSKDSVPKDLAGGVNNDKPDDIADIHPGLSSSHEEHDHNDNTIKVDGLLPVEDKDTGSIHVDGKLPNGSGEGNINIDGLSSGEDEHKPDEGVDKHNDHLGIPDGNIVVNGLEPGHEDHHGSLSIDDEKPDRGGKSKNVDGNSLNIGGGINLSGETANDGKGAGYIDNIDVIGPSSGADDNGSDHGDNDVNVNEPLPNGNHKNSDHDSMNGDDLSPGGDDKPHDNNFNGNGLSPGGDDVNEHGNVEGGLPSEDLGGSNGAHIDDKSEHNHDGLLPIPDHGANEHPIFPGSDILPNPHLDLGKPDEADEGKYNISSLFPHIVLPGGGHAIVYPSGLGNMPSYILMMINGQPTLVQNPGFSVGGGNGGSVDLSKLIIGSIGGINGGAVLPNWLNLGGLGGGNIQQPIWIGSQLPNLGGGGGVTGPIIIPSSDPVPVPVPVPSPPPILPGPIDPGFNIPYPDFPWPSLWKPPTVNANLTDVPLLPNVGSNIDLKHIIDLLVKIGSQLPKPVPQPTPQPQPKPEPQPNPQTQPNYPQPNPYPYPPYPQPYPYPPQYPQPPYPYPQPYPYPRPYPDQKKPPSPGKIVPDIAIDHNTDETDGYPRFPGDDIIPNPFPLFPPSVRKPNPYPQPKPQPIPTPLTPIPEPLPTLEPLPQPQPIPLPLPVPQPHPIPEPVPQPLPIPEPVPLPQPIPQPHPQPLPIPQPQPVPLPQPIPQPVPQPLPIPEPVPHPQPVPQPIPELQPIPLPQPIPQPQPVPQPLPEPLPQPQPQPIPEPVPHPQPIPEPRPQPQPIPEPVPLPQPSPEPRPLPQPTPEPVPQPQPIPESRPLPIPEPVPVPHPQPQPIPEPRPLPIPELRPELVPEPDISSDKDKNRPDIPHINVELPKPHKPRPGKNGLNGGLIDILNVLLKFPNRGSNSPKNLGPLVNLLLTILKNGKNQNEGNKGEPNLNNLAHLLLHVLDSHKEPNVNVLVEPGMDESTRANLLLLLKLLANNLGNSYGNTGYYQQENPLLYFLGHFPCDHPSYQALAEEKSNSNLWQLIGNMYGNGLGRTEIRLDRSAEEGDKPAEPAHIL